MFVSNVSHEMRTPLAALIAELDLCLQKDRTEAQYRQAMQNVLQDARRMTKLIDGLLNLAKADYQKEQIKMHEIRLDELLLDTREIILRAHPEYHIELIFEQEDAEDDRMITVMGNDYLLNIAFANLIENNCKYSDDKSSFIQISYWDKWTIIRLSDDGIGMSDAEKKRFSPCSIAESRNSIRKDTASGWRLHRKSSPCIRQYSRTFKARRRNDLHHRTSSHLIFWHIHSKKHKFHQSGIRKLVSQILIVF